MLVFMPVSVIVPSTIRYKSDTETSQADITWFNSYHPYADHLQFLRDLVAANPARSEIVTAGNSVNGRPITGIHIYGSGGKGSKPAIVLHGTVHAREWVTGMVGILNICNVLLLLIY